ncbi:hypothetical protein GGR58DRAFT_229240 [Xylaria digitata]|nr:hypothetical protein GGR58DRAFT_229240 [Xylaria digitata]
MAHDQNQHKELLTIVREPPGPGISSLVDVIALHGLFSTFDKTWRGLEDECAFSPWLEKLPFRARIFSYAGVMSLSSEQGMLDKSALEASAKDLLAEISKKTEKKRPIVFLCHNIAGVLVKELLWIANHDKRYFHIALDTKAVVCLGLLDTSSSWDEGLLRLVLATTDSNTNDDPRTRRAEITEVIRNGASALRAATMRFEMIKHKYRIVSACEVAPEDGGGVPVGPILEHDADLRILMPVTHDRLPLSPPPDSVINFILRATEASTQDYQYDAMACRQRLATQYEYDEDVGKLSLGIRSPIVSPLCEKLAGQRSGLLTIYGSAGSGKSVLASQIAEIVLGAGNNIIVLSFAFSVADYRRSSYRDLLLLFLVQLLYREDSVFNSIYVRKVYSRLQKDLDLSWANLHLLLCAMLSNLSKKSIVCVIDAIDECDEESRVQLVGDFKRMALEGPVECMVFLTSRPSDSVTRLLGPFKENSNVDLDKNKDHVRSRLLERDFESEQLQDVRRRLDEEKAAPLKLSLIAALGRMEELSDIPNRYNSIYKRIIARIDAPPAWLEAVLLCLAFAERPLTVAELAGAIGVDYCSQTLDGAELTLQQIGVAAPKQLRDDLELVAGSLVCIRKNVVSLVHGTLRDTIRQDPGILKKSNKAPVSNNDQTVTGSSRALHISLAILSAPELSDLKDVATRSRPFDHLCSVPVSSQAHNFARYAGSSLAHQLRGTNAGDNLEKATQDTRDVFSMFWDNVVARSWWIQTFTTFQREAISSSLKEPLCFAAFVGHQSAVKSLLLEAKYDIQIIKLALQVAISSRNAETTRLLLTISQDLKEDVWQFAIESSCDYGRAELLTSVLSWRKEVVGHELSEDELHSCLRLVAKNGHWHIISVLREAYPQMMSAVRRETLVSLIEEAASEGRDGVISVLLSMDESRGEITELGSPSRTTTMQQAQGQTMTEEVAENNRGTRDDLGLGLAMIKAARFGNAAVVRLLASTCNSAPEYREDKTGMTALHSAAVCKLKCPPIIPCLLPFYTTLRG